MKNHEKRHWKILHKNSEDPQRLVVLRFQVESRFVPGNNTLCKLFNNIDRQESHISLLDWQLKLLLLSCVNFKHVLHGMILIMMDFLNPARWACTNEHSIGASVFAHYHAWKCQLSHCFYRFPASPSPSPSSTHIEACNKDDKSCGAKEMVMVIATLPF